MGKSRWRRPFAILVILGGGIVGLTQLKWSTGPASGASFSSAPATRPSRSTLHIATFNIDGGQGSDGVVDLNRTAKCLPGMDFIGLNEVHGYLFRDPPNQAIDIANRLKLPYLFVPAERKLFFDSFGNAALSDLPVRSWRRVTLPSNLLSAGRNYLVTTVEFRSRSIEFFTTHTDWKVGGEAQLKAVVDAFLAAPVPAVLMGDLNAPASSPAIAALQNVPGVEDAITKMMGRLPGRVDWIFLRGLTTVDAWSVDQLHASDHPAYWAEVAVN